MNKNENEIEWNENEKYKWTGNKIGDEGATKISESLMTNTTLTELNLSYDDIDI